MKALSPEQQKEIFSKVDEARKKGKTTNYSAIYGVGAAKLARELKIPVKEAKKLLEAYWKKHWAVKAYSEKVETKTVNGQKWLRNPINGFFYSLRNDRDIWSTLNQGSGSYCFDSWLREILKIRKQLTATYHDECILEVKEGNYEKAKDMLETAINIVNDKLKLNVKLAVDTHIGKRYSDIH